MLQASPYNYIKNEALVQVFSCEFWGIFKNILFTEHLRTTVSGYTLLAIYFTSLIPVSVFH